MDWSEKRRWAAAEHERRRTAAAAEGEREDLRLAGVAGASWAEGLACLMLGDGEAAVGALRRAADEYAASWLAAPPGSWGRPIAMIRCRLIVGDGEGARIDAEAAIAAGALDATGPIGGYCAALALLTLDRDTEAAGVAERIAVEGLEPIAVAHALHALVQHDESAFAEARLRVLRSFEERDAFLEDVPVADTVLVLDALARERRLATPAFASPLLPPVRQGSG